MKTEQILLLAVAATLISAFSVFVLGLTGMSNFLFCCFCGLVYGLVKK